MSKRFGALEAVRDCTFAVEGGRVTGLVGPNGAGKTTTFNMIAGAERPSGGEIAYGDREITGMSLRGRVALGIGRTFQDVRLFPELSVIDNVAVGVPGQSGERLRNVLLRPLGTRADRRDSFARAREALDFVGFGRGAEEARAKELSYGEQKLVSLARLLALGAELLLLDEPASGLDGASVEHLQQLVRELASSGRTVLIVEHNMLLVRTLCDHVVFLDHGTVVADGGPEELMADRELRERYLGAVEAPTEASS